MSEVVRDVADVLDALEIDAAPWIGYSMGGRVAVGGAVLAPERVSRLVLEGASPGLRTTAARAERRERDEALARWIEDEGIEAFVERWMALPLFETQRRLPEDVLRAARRRRLRNRPGALADTLRGLGTGAQPSFWDALPEVAVPVLLLTGADDAKFGGIADAMAEALPDARQVTVHGAGHTVHLEAAGAWLDAVDGFLGRPRAAG